MEQLASAANIESEYLRDEKGRVRNNMHGDQAREDNEVKAAMGNNIRGGTYRENCHCSACPPCAEEIHLEAICHTCCLLCMSCVNYGVGQSPLLQVLNMNGVHSGMPTNASKRMRHLRYIRMTCNMYEKHNM